NHDHRMSLRSQRPGERMKLGVISAFEAELHEDAVAAVMLRRCKRLAGHGQYPAPLLARALGDQLLDPEPERCQRPRNDERQLVAALQRQLTHRGAETQCLAVRSTSRLARSDSPIEELRNIDASRCCRGEPEVRQRGVAAAYIAG